MKRSEAIRLRAIVETAAVSLDDRTASEAAALFPRLKRDGALVPAGTRVNFGGTIKRAAVDLWDTEANNPENAPAGLPHRAGDVHGDKRGEQGRAALVRRAALRKPDGRQRLHAGKLSGRLGAGAGVMCYCSPLDTFEFGFVSGMLSVSLLMILFLLALRLIHK